MSADVIDMNRRESWIGTISWTIDAEDAESILEASFRQLVANAPSLVRDCDFARDLTFAYGGGGTTGTLRFWADTDEARVKELTEHFVPKMQKMAPGLLLTFERGIWTRSTQETTPSATASTEGATSDASTWRGRCFRLIRFLDEHPDVTDEDREKAEAVLKRMVRKAVR